MLRWFKKAFRWDDRDTVSKAKIITVQFPPKSVVRLEAMVVCSTWNTEIDILKEALRVCEAIYTHREVTCVIEDGKIEMYIMIEGPDGGSKIRSGVITVDFTAGKKAA